MPRVDRKKMPSVELPLKVLTIKNEQGANQLEKLIRTGWTIINVAANNSVIVYILRK